MEGKDDNIHCFPQDVRKLFQDSESALTLYPFLPLSFLLVLFLQFTYQSLVYIPNLSSWGQVIFVYMQHIIKRKKNQQLGMQTICERYRLINKKCYSKTFQYFKGAVSCTIWYNASNCHFMVIGNLNVFHIQLQEIN